MNEFLQPVHPEARGDESEIINEQQKEELLKLIEENAIRGYYHNGIPGHESYGIDLDVPEENRMKINLTWYSEDKRYKDGNGTRIAVLTVNRMSDDYRFHNTTHYTFYQTSESVEVQKYLQYFDMKEDNFESDDESMEEIMADIERLRKKIDATEKAQKEEFELGLTTVSEKEADEVLELLRKAYPSNPKFRK